MKAPVLNRKLHRWGAILTAPVVLVIICTGLLLQLKKEIDWIQPPTVAGEGEVPSVSFQAILDAAIGVEEAGLHGWADIERVDVRPHKGVAKVRGHNRWEVQVDVASGEVLQVSYRRSDLIENLHDGSWFVANATKLYVFFPVAIVLLGLWVTGLYLWFLPHIYRRRTRKKIEALRSGGTP